MWAVLLQPPQAPPVGFWGGEGWARCFSGEKKDNVMPRLGLEWWKQELSLHPQELSELNQRILLPCWICVLSCPLWKGSSRARFVSSPTCGDRNALRGHEGEGGGPGSSHRAVLAWFARWPT